MCSVCAARVTDDWAMHHDGPVLTRDFMKALARAEGRAGTEAKVLTKTLCLASPLDWPGSPAPVSSGRASRGLRHLFGVCAGGDVGRPDTEGGRYLAPALLHYAVVPHALR